MTCGCRIILSEINLLVIDNIIAIEKDILSFLYRSFSSIFSIFDYKEIGR